VCAQLPVHIVRNKQAATRRTHEGIMIDGSIASVTANEDADVDKVFRVNIAVHGAKVLLQSWGVANRRKLRHGVNQRLERPTGSTLSLAEHPLMAGLKLQILGQRFWAAAKGSSAVSAAGQGHGRLYRTPKDAASTAERGRVPNRQLHARSALEQRD
jgi:hypothetical protein